MFTAIVFALLLLPFIAIIPHVALADSSQDLSITPVVIDEKGKAQDIINETLSITNTSDHKLDLYPSVNDVKDDSGTQAFSYAYNADQASNSLANWIELSRGVIELGPGEEKSVPFVIRINSSAVSGSYHAVITFASGETRDIASKNGPLASLTVNLDLQADVKELMQLNRFTTDNVVFTGDDVLFKYQLQNIGNQDLDPKGEIRIYDRHGEEVASVDVNNEGKVISPDQVSQLASVWSGASGFGKYKAVIDVEYGKSQVASVQDETYFWVVPWKEVLGITIATLIAVIFLALYFHRWLEEKTVGKLLHAGVIKAEALVHFRAQQPPSPLEKVAEVAPQAAAVLGKAQETVKAKLDEKKEQLEQFKRFGFAPQSIVPQPAAPAPAPPSPAQTHVQPAPGTIDLKKMWQPQDKPAVPEHHVINLKGQ